MDDQPAFPSKFQRRTMWRALTGLAILVLGLLLVGLIWLMSTTLGYLQPVLVPLAVAGIVAYLLDPVVHWLQNKGLSRIKGIVVVFLGFLIFFGVLFAFVGVRLADQLDTSLANNSKFEPSEVVGAKRNKIYGWAVRHFFKKDPDAYQNAIAKKELINGPSDQVLRDYSVNEEQLKEIFHSSWNTQPPAQALPTDKDSQNSSDSRTNDITPPQESEQKNNQPEESKVEQGGAPASASTEQNLDPEESGDLRRQEFEQKERLATIESSIALNNMNLTWGGKKAIGFADTALSWFTNSYSKILGFFGIIIGFAMVPIYLYYFLKESDAIKNQWQDYVPLKASKFKTEVIETLQEINGYLISFFRGQVLVAFIDGILVGIALTIFDLNYGLLIGVVMALLGIIPYIGNIICLIPACIIAAVQSADEAPWGLPQWGYVVGVVAIFIIVQQINSLITAPKIVGDSVGLHPMTVIFSMLFWSLILGGFLGALLAVPLTAAVKVLFRRYVWEKQELETSPAAA